MTVLGRLRRGGLSLRARLVAGSTAVLVVAVGTADLTAYLALRDHLSERTTESLHTAARRIELAPTERPISLGPNLIQSLVPAGLFVALLDEGGDVLLASAPAGSGSAPDELADSPLDRYPAGDLVRQDTSDGSFLLLRVEVPAGATVTAGPDETTPVEHVLLGADLGPTQEATAALVRTELLVGLVILVVWAATAWAVVGLGLRPLHAMARAAHRIAVRGDGRLPDAPPGSETGTLAAALNEAFAVRSRAEARARGFLADASHELRTPLAAIRAWTELYRVGGLASAEAVADAMSSMEADAQRMSGVVEQMLELARLEAAGGPGWAPVELVGLTRGVVEGLRPLSGDRVGFQADPEQTWVRGDADQLRSLVLNLVGNALTHAGETARIEVGVGRSGDGRSGDGRSGERAVVTVTDDGPGLSPAEIERAFDRFWRADRSHSRPGGSGLGLAIVQETARQHGGSVALGAVRPTGLVATVELPLADPPGSADVQDHSSTAEAGEPA